MWFMRKTTPQFCKQTNSIAWKYSMSTISEYHCLINHATQVWLLEVLCGSRRSGNLPTARMPKRPKGEYGCCCSLTQSFSNRYLTPPATSTAVERLFSAAGLIMDAKRNKLSPTFVDKLLFLREAHLLGICKLDWKWKTRVVVVSPVDLMYRK